MKIKLFTLVFIIFLSSLAACSPSEQANQEALAQTQTAQVPNTSTPEPTATFTLEPSFTPTFTGTPTDMLALTPTPDKGVITMDSKDLLLDKEDLPPEAKYYLPSFNWRSHYQNPDILSEYGVEEGPKYLETTGRIDGWVIYYLIGTTTVRAPEEAYQNIAQFESAEGAYLALSEYNAVERFPDTYIMLDEEVLIGDAALVYYSKEVQDNGETKVRYCVGSVYRNYLSTVCGRGLETTFDLDYVIRIAEIAMEKIKSAPLGNW